MYAHICEAVSMKVNPVRDRKAKGEEIEQGRRKERPRRALGGHIQHNVLFLFHITGAVPWPCNHGCRLLLAFAFFPLCIWENLAVHLINCERGHVRLQRVLLCAIYIKSTDDFYPILWACMQCPDAHNDPCSLHMYSVQSLLTVHPACIMGWLLKIGHTSCLCPSRESLSWITQPSEMKLLVAVL